MNDIDAITPLKDVWLRPRRVFREMASRPIGVGDLALTSLQGIANFVLRSRLSMAETHATVQEVLVGSLLLGSLGGLLGTAFWAFVYNKIGTRLGAKSGFTPVFHVLSYGAVPWVAAFLLWAGIALVVGDAAFVSVPPAGTDSFVVVLLRAETIAMVLLFLWASLVQIMGLSEVFDFKLRKAFGVWASGQLIALLFVLLALNLAGAPR
ncbi:MAG TPA: YIP1 family protein [Steroidobacteraceae bacterium]